MLRIFAILFGIVFIFIGVAGFFPHFATNNLLFGIFLVDRMHNIVHIVSGILAIMAATSEYWTRIYFQALGIIYAIVAILGFWREGDLFIKNMNMADNVLHIGIAVVALYLGFVVRPKPTYY